MPTSDPSGTFTEAALIGITTSGDQLIPFINVTAALEAVHEHYDLYGADDAGAGVRSARKHIGWAVHALPGGEAFRSRMNLLDNCEAQVRAVTDWFDALADTHHLLPSSGADSSAAARDSSIEDTSFEKLA